MSINSTSGKKRKVAVASPTPAKRMLLADLREMILKARESVARVVDSGLTLLYWNVGERIRKDTLKEKRAEYGEEIVSALRRQLTYSTVHSGADKGSEGMKFRVSDPKKG